MMNRGRRARAIMPCVLCVFLCASCAPTAVTAPVTASSPAVTAPSSPPPAPAPTPTLAPTPEPPYDWSALTREDFLADSDFMCAVIDEYCPYVAEMKTTPRRGFTVDWEGAKQRYRAELESMALTELTPRKWYALAERWLGSLRDAGHIRAIHASSIPRYAEFQQAVDHERLRNAAAVHPRAEAFYALQNSVASVISTPTATESPDRVIQRTFIPDVVEGHTYLQMKSFDFPFGMQGDAIEWLMSYFARNTDKKHIIIDLRGNGGGSDGIWFAGVLRPLLQKDASAEELWAMTDSAYSLIERYGLVSSCTEIPRARWSEFGVAEIPDIDRLLSRTASYPVHERRVPWDGQMWVLVDDRVASAADNFVRFCKKTGFATVVGTRTGGLGGGSAPEMAMLPNTGLIFRYEVICAFNDDGTYNQITGTLPDIDSGTSSNALDACLKAIRSGN